MEFKAKIYLRLIGIILLIIPIFDLTINGHFSDFIKGFEDGYQNNYKNYNYLDIVPINDYNLSKEFPKIEGKVIADKIELAIYSKNSLNIIPFYNWALYTILVLAVIIFLFSIIRLIKRFIKGQLFEISTYNTLLYFGFSLLAITLLDFILEVIKRQNLLKYIDTSLYTISNDNLLDISSLFISLFVLAFAIALKQSINIKEENDLTV
ncbi:DUF2975 domain-containing protein [Chishuiella sp.]|uniref:DUF2975 domain-containing protein n=1 Tax=Chishuiella sp. TaxID=1969467 RepID=UPI0028B1EE27|nr:DUF2975 domain-containing protein [Chishuiella sp.]